jgi:hypothetical protein
VDTNYFWTSISEVKDAALAGDHLFELHRFNILLPEEDPISVVFHRAAKKIHKTMFTDYIIVLYHENTLPEGDTVYTTDFPKRGLVNGVSATNSTSTTDYFGSHIEITEDEDIDIASSRSSIDSFFLLQYPMTVSARKVSTGEYVGGQIVIDVPPGREKIVAGTHLIEAPDSNHFLVTTTSNQIVIVSFNIMTANPENYEIVEIGIPLSSTSRGTILAT